MGDVQSDNPQWDIPVPASELVPIALSEQEWKHLIETFLKGMLLPESYQVYTDALAQGAPITNAVYDAVRNEAANDALVSVVMKEALKDYDIDIHPKSPVRMVWVTFQKEGIHLYPAAATDPNLKTGGWDDVSFLGVPHRHIFHFRVAMEVFHDDRDVEFIQLKRWCERLYAEGTLDLNRKSCEMLSDDLHAKLTERWPGRKITIDVSEDGENGSTTSYPA